jgi:archaellum component FlaF (FlaF/FlaG flagellin family)
MIKTLISRPKSSEGYVNVKELYRKKILKKPEAIEIKYLTPFRLKFTYSRHSPQSISPKERKFADTKTANSNFTANTGLTIQMLSYPKRKVSEFSPRANKSLNASYGGKQVIRCSKINPLFNSKIVTVAQSKSVNFGLKASKVSLNQSTCITRKNIKLIFNRKSEKRTTLYTKYDCLSGWET